MVRQHNIDPDTILFLQETWLSDENHSSQAICGVFDSLYANINLRLGTSILHLADRSQMRDMFVQQNAGIEHQNMNVAPSDMIKAIATLFGTAVLQSWVSTLRKNHTSIC